MGSRSTIPAGSGTVAGWIETSPAPRRCDALAAVRDVPVGRVRSVPGPLAVVDDGIDGREGIDGSDGDDGPDVADPGPALPPPSATFAGALVPQTSQ